MPLLLTIVFYGLYKERLMVLGKTDVLNMAFSRSLRGYACSEVDNFLQEVVETLGLLNDEKVVLRARVNHLEESLDDYKSREKTLRNALKTLQRITDDLKLNAQKEAQLIIDAAHSKADAMLEQAVKHTTALRGDIENLTRQRTQCELKLRSLLNTHLQILDTDVAELKVLEELDELGCEKEQEDENMDTKDTDKDDERADFAQSVAGDDEKREFDVTDKNEQDREEAA